MTLKFNHLAIVLVDDVGPNVGIHLGSLWGHLVEKTFLLIPTEMCRERKVGHGFKIQRFGL